MRIPDFRRRQGRWHTAACELSVHILAELANMKGCLVAVQFAKALSQNELAAVGAWRNRRTGLCEPPSKSTIHRVVQMIDPEALEDAVGRHCGPRLPLARALAADVRRIRGASRNGADHHETAALVDHASGAPFALPNFGDDGGEPAAAHDLLERSDIRGRVITLDALHTTRKTAKPITERSGADCVFPVEGNAQETFGILDGIDWERDATGRFAEDPEKARGRPSQRSISVPAPLKRLIDCPGVSRTARVARCREPLRKDGDDGGKDHTETAHVITSLDVRGRVAGGPAPAEPPAPGSGEHEPPTKSLRLRRGHLLDPHGRRPGEPGHARQHRARGGVRQPPRGGKPRRNPATAAAEPQRSHCRPDPALSGGNASGNFPGHRRTAAKPPKRITQGPKTALAPPRGRLRKRETRPEHADPSSVHRLFARLAAAWESLGELRYFSPAF